MKWSELAARFEVVESTVDVSDALTLRLARVRAAEDAPFWSCVWPSGLALATAIVEGPRLSGPALELGAGLGLVSMALASAGVNVVATDRSSEALAFVRHNAALNDLPVDTRLWDWRQPSLLTQTFATIVASDVLYDADHIGPVANAVANHLAPGGVALVADPGRAHRAAFAAALRTLGFAVESSDYVIIRASRQPVSHGP